MTQALRLVDGVGARVSMLRTVGLVPVVIRVAIAVAAAAAVTATGLAPDHEFTLLFAGAIAAAVGCVVMPDSFAAMTLVGTLGGSWFFVGDGEVDVWLTVTVVALVCTHVLCSLAATMPLTGSAEPDVVVPWLVAGALISLATAAVAGGLVALERGERDGIAALTLIAVAGMAALAVWWAAQPGDGSSNPR